jgi:hypothetical protein
MTNQPTSIRHSIGLDQAKKMTKKFRDDKDKIVKAEHQGKNLLPICESFERAAFDRLLQREDCKGVRIYFGMKEADQQLHAIIVGYDSQGKDILPAEGQVMDSTETIIIEDGTVCPNDCPPPSPLNT